MKSIDLRSLNNIESIRFLENAGFYAALGISGCGWKVPG
jgi:hypothetical protein